MIRNWLVGVFEDALSNVYPFGSDVVRREIQVTKQYREGQQPQQLKVKPGQTDDNITVNLTGLVVDRAISLLFGDGVKFDLPGEGETTQDTWLEACWKLNKKAEFLSDIAEYGAVTGTPYVQFIPDGVYDEAGTAYPAVIPGDPEYLKIVTEPNNYRKVKRYEIEWISMEEVPNQGAKEIRRKRVIEPEYEILTDDAGMVTGRGNKIASWLIADYVYNEAGQWVLTPATPPNTNPLRWEKPWAPILAWKNLPKAGTQYGRPDLTKDILHLQDKINQVFSNGNKVTRLTAHRQLWGKGLLGMKSVEIGPSTLLQLPDKDGEIQAIEAGTPEPVVLFGGLLREFLFLIARSTDSQAIKDKIGQVTNFAVRLLWKDAIDKVKTKRELYGEALLEINRRLLELGDQPSDPGKIIWPDPLPLDQADVIKAQEFELRNGLTSKQTIREERGRDNETEQERIDAERETDNQNNQNVGGQILANFNRSVPR